MKRSVRSRWFGLVLVMGLSAVAWGADAPASAEPLLKPGDRLAIIGDSITQQKLYSVYMETYLLACRPDLNLCIANFGWSGERAPGFARRLDWSLSWFKPTVATTCFGMNDGSYRAYTNSIGAIYEKGMQDVVVGLKALSARILVGSPGPVDSFSYHRSGAEAAVYNENLTTLSGIAGRVAATNGCSYVDLNAILRDSMAKAKAALGDEFLVCGPDGVHPGPDGHLVMAYAFLKGLGLDGDIGTITVSMKGTATATPGHRVLSAADGTVNLESTRYPFCFTGNEKDPNGTRSILPFVPFNQDLNRFVLVVKDLAADSAKVTWGDQQKTFTRAQLEKGINLAAEYDVTPFDRAFAAVQSAVSRQQDLDINIVKQAIPTLDYITRTLDPAPDVTAAKAMLLDRLVEKEAAVIEATRALVVPVTHTLKVEVL